MTEVEELLVKNKNSKSARAYGCGLMRLWNVDAVGGQALSIGLMGPCYQMADRSEHCGASPVFGPYEVRAGLGLDL